MKILVESLSGWVKFRNPIFSINWKSNFYGKTFFREFDFTSFFGLNFLELTGLLYELLFVYNSKFQEIFIFTFIYSIQDPDDKQFFLPDKKMSKMCGTERIHFTSIHRGLTAHMFEMKDSKW